MKTRLQELRIAAGFKSAKSFAASCGIPYGAYMHYEQGDSKFTLENAWRIADVLGVSLDTLMERETPKSDACADSIYRRISALDAKSREKVEEYIAFIEWQNSMAPSVSTGGKEGEHEQEHPLEIVLDNGSRTVFRAPGIENRCGIQKAVASRTRTENRR